MSPPAVSVVIPTRGRPELARRAVASALGQRLAENAAIEVIVVIDGPDDATRRALEAVADPRLRVIELPARGGAPAARNAGVEAAGAPWVALLDDDDEWYPDKLEAQLAAARACPHPFPVVACRMEFRLPGGAYLAPRRPPRPGEAPGDYLFARRSLFRDEGVIQTSMLFAPRELLVRVPFREGLRRHHEADWLLRAAAEVQGVHLLFVERPLGVWHAEAAGGRVSETGGWRYSLEWARERRGELSPRAFAAFLLTAVGALAARERAWDAFYPVLAEARRRGRPAPVHYLLYLAMWLIPRRLRAAIRGAARRRPKRGEGS